MADLESTLHYSLRLELAAHPVIKGEALSALQRYISVLAKVIGQVYSPPETNPTHTEHSPHIHSSSVHIEHPEERAV